MSEQWTDWIEWNGGECPIPWAKAGEYETRLSGGQEIYAPAIDAKFFSYRQVDWWKHESKAGNNIVAYRYRRDRAPKNETGEDND